MQVGDKIKILPPFDISYPNEYIIIEIVEDVYFVEGIEGGFCIDYIRSI